MVRIGWVSSDDSRFDMNHLNGSISKKETQQFNFIIICLCVNLVGSRGSTTYLPPFTPFTQRTFYDAEKSHKSWNAHISIRLSADSSFYWGNHRENQMDFNVYWIKKLDAKLIQRGVTLVQNSVITFFFRKWNHCLQVYKLYTLQYVYMYIYLQMNTFSMLALRVFMCVFASAGARRLNNNDYYFVCRIFVNSCC